jgi:hypothetical protein
LAIRWTGPHTLGFGWLRPLHQLGTMRPCHALIEKPDARSSDATRSREFTVPRWAGCSSLGVGSSLIDTAAVGVSSWSLEKSFAICERHDAVQTHRPAKKLLAIKDIYHAPADLSIVRLVAFMLPRSTRRRCTTDHKRDIHRYNDQAGFQIARSFERAA